MILQYLSGLVCTAFKAVIPLQVIIVDSKGLISAPGKRKLYSSNSSFKSCKLALIIAIACDRLLAYLENKSC
jgi:hypothetical protein